MPSHKEASGAPGMPHIDTVWAFLAVDSSGDEGIMGFLSPNGWVPAVAADVKRLMSVRPMVERAARGSGFTVKLARFDGRTDLEEFVPGKVGWQKIRK